MPRTFFPTPFPQRKVEATLLGIGIGIGGCLSSALLLLPRMSPEPLLQNNPGALRSQWETHCLKLCTPWPPFPWCLKAPVTLPWEQIPE